MNPQHKYHVLMTADTVGGVWTYAIELARGLAGWEVQVSLATMGAALSAEQKSDARSLSNLQVYESSYRLEWMKNPWEDVRCAGQWLLDLERRLKPDIVHLNSYAHGALPWSAPTVVVAHSCVSSWWRAVHGEDCDSTWEPYQRAVAQGLRSATSIVAPSTAMLKALYAHYGPIPTGKVIPNGRSGYLFLPHTKKPFIFTAGRLWDKAKNVRLLEQIADDLPWPVRIAGDPHEPGTANVRQFSGVEKLGRLSQEQLRLQYGEAAIYAAPAKYEPFGLSILEAALSGCTLVLGDIPSLREIWDGAAIFVDPDNPSHLRMELLKLIGSALLRDNLSLRSRKLALQYSVERMTASYMRVYTALLRNTVRPNSTLRIAAPRN